MVIHVRDDVACDPGMSGHPRIVSIDPPDTAAT